MLARRIIAVSPDKAFSKQISVALKASGGAVDTHTSLDTLGKGELQAALLVVHLDGPLAGAASELLPRLSGDTRVIAILPRSNLAAVVDIMQASDRVSGMMVAEDFDTRMLSSMATRVLAGDIFGLEKMILWGTQIHSFLVGDYQEKSLCISQISEFAELMGVRRKYREAIEQCVDEMLMNALYDAPVDDQGKQIFTEIPIKTRISLRVEQKVVVQYACDGTQFAVAVRDAFGTLERSTVLRYLHKCLHNEQQIDRKAGGAGLGLYLMTNSSTTVYFNVLPGVATEALCIFDLETPKLQLETFGFFTEKIDAAGRLATGPSRRLPSSVGHPVERRASRAPAPATPKGLVAVLIAAIVATLALVVAVAWPRLMGSGPKKTSVSIHTQPPGATIEIDGKNAGTVGPDGTLVVRDLEVGRAYPVVARADGYEPKRDVVQPRDGANDVTIVLAAQAPTVNLDSSPSGANVEIDGTSVGTTPLTLKTLEPGKTITITFKKAGFKDVVATLEVPGPGKDTRLIQPLPISSDLARIKLTSEPPGAQVVQNGTVLAGVTTPAEVLVEAGKPVKFTLTLQGKVPATIDTFTPGRGADGVVKHGKLIDGTLVNVTSNLEGKATLGQLAHCQSLELPAACMAPPGTYFLDVTVVPQNAAGGRVTRKLVVANKAKSEAVEFGYVEAPAGRTLQVGGGPGVKRAVFEVGNRKVTVTGGEDPPKTVTVNVKAGATVVAN
ncbi:MAG: PEGA domain-containing protein [Myxococcales bacterium]|nr:PEGA domain-containing protein [Myxococcales bacterium]